MEDKIKTYLISNIDVFEVSENEVYWSREPEMHPIKNNEPIKNIEVQIWQQLKPVKFSRNGKIFSIALPPELQDFFCLPFEEFHKMDNKISELQTAKNKAEQNFIKTAENYKKMNAESKNKIESLESQLIIKQSSLRFALETAEKYCKAVFEFNHAGFLKRLKYLFTGRF